MEQKQDPKQDTKQVVKIVCVLILILIGICVMLEKFGVDVTSPVVTIRMEVKEYETFRTTDIDEFVTFIKEFDETQYQMVDIWEERIPVPGKGSEVYYNAKYISIDD